LKQHPSIAARKRNPPVAQCDRTAEYVVQWHGLPAAIEISNHVLFWRTKMSANELKKLLSNLPSGDISNVKPRVVQLLSAAWGELKGSKEPIEWLRIDRLHWQPPHLLFVIHKFDEARGRGKHCVENWTLNLSRLTVKKRIKSERTPGALHPTAMDALEFDLLRMSMLSGNKKKPKAVR
jgi:hypothetical protein